jgi:pilus assembly protein Flp/PilA
MRRLIVKLIRNDHGATAIEYGLICALVFVVAVGAMSAFGHNATNMFDMAATAIDSGLK